MNHIRLRGYFQAALIVIVFVLICGCGNGGSASNEVASNSASISITQSNNSEYVVNGDNLDGVAGISLTINYDYDNSVVPTPSVIQGGFISGALMAANTSIPGTIKIVIIRHTPFSGNGQLATISFAGLPGIGNVSISSISMIDDKSVPIP